MGVPCVKEPSAEGDAESSKNPRAMEPQASSPRGSSPGGVFGPASTQHSGDAFRSPFAAAVSAGGSRAANVADVDADDSSTGPPERSSTAATQPPPLVELVAVAAPRSRRSSATSTCSSQQSRETGDSTSSRVASRRTRRHSSRHDAPAASFASILDDLTVPHHSSLPIRNYGSDRSGQGRSDAAPPVATTGSTSSSASVVELTHMDRESARKALFEAVSAASPTLKILRMHANRASTSHSRPPNEVGDDTSATAEVAQSRPRSNFDRYGNSSATAVDSNTAPRHAIDKALE